MKMLWSCAALAVFCLAPPGRAEEPTKPPPKSFQVPYRLTKPKHILVRAKINGKGPYNFIVDTGAPALFVAVPVARKLGVKSESNGWGTFDRFEIEGGVVLTKVKGRVETPPQVEGMNGLGLAGVELHGMIGYNILARYRMEIDLTRDKMIWTPLDYKPKESKSLAGKGRGGSEIDLLGGILKSLGSLLGTKASPPVRLRGFLGVELKDGADFPIVQSVLADGPAGKAGVKPGDQITHIRGRGVTDTSDVQRFLDRLVVGDDVKLTVQRGKEKKDIAVKIGEGL
ncbi:MAG TPA: PDZ domain-containing protein [Gemmataceae bacterium]|nr:PDZ domain-containing protein [Gemmataceae bacterium]